MSDAPAPKRKSTRTILIFALVIGAVYVVTQWNLTGGTPVRWGTDLDAALKKAKGDNRRVLLYMYEPGERFALRNEREVFTQRSVRDVLAKMECVRVELKNDVTAHVGLREKYGYRNAAKMIVLNPDGSAVEQGVDGMIEEKNFRTYIQYPAERPPK